MEIIRVTERNICEAGRIHAESWRESHRDFCTAEFIARHTEKAQTEYIRDEIAKGKVFYMLLDGKPVGVVSLQGSLIENLYVLPDEQQKGYGTRLLREMIAQCDGVPTLWVLSNNERANAFYRKHGFRESGKRAQLRSDLHEIEMVLNGEVCHF